MYIYEYNNLGNYNNNLINTFESYISTPSLEITPNYYNTNIQLDKTVIRDIFNNFTSTSKMLVFGLGYDSKMWFNGNKNTYFVEDNEEYIKLNENDIPSENIIFYNYNTTVKDSFKMSDKDIYSVPIPTKIIELSPFDIILIDGPAGYNSEQPGRLLPCYFSNLVSRKGSIVYIDDSSRPLETYCINKFFKDKQKTIFKNRLQSTKIII